jgi:hypothetical protein
MDMLRPSGEEQAGYGQARLIVLTGLPESPIRTTSDRVPQLTSSGTMKLIWKSPKKPGA